MHTSRLKTIITLLSIQQLQPQPQFLGTPTPNPSTINQTHPGIDSNAFTGVTFIHVIKAFALAQHEILDIICSTTSILRDLSSARILS